MKARLTFNLDDHEEVKAHLRAIKSLDLALFIHDFDQFVLRGMTKYSHLDDKELGEWDQYEMASRIRDKFYELLEEREIRLFDIID